MCKLPQDMAEAELRRETEKMFQDMGITELPGDTLDFFQRNLENEGGGSSSDWKRSLMGPRPRRTSSDGKALVHLKKKYATGLNPDYHSQRNAAIAAVTQVQNSSTTDSKEKLRTRKVTPASGLKGRFGYSGPVSSRSKGSSPAEGSKEPEEVSGGSSTASSTGDPTTTVREVDMLKRRTPRSKAVVDVGPTDSKEASSRKLVHTSSAGSVLKQPQSRGQATTGYDSSISRRHFGSTRAPEPSGMQPSSNIQAPTPPNGHSYKSPITTNVNTVPTSTSSGISSIDSLKLSSVNMRSLTKATPERKLSTERKVSTERRVSLERRFSSERRISDTEKPSGIPVPAQVSKSSGASKGVEGSDEGNNTQVVFSRKSSFKVLNVSSSSHRILHTVQDGGAPKRQNSISRGARPVSILTESSAQQNVGTTRPPLLTRQVPKQENQSPSLRGSGQDSSGSSSFLVAHSALVEEGAPQRQGAKMLSQSKKEGVYDRLAENPAAKNMEPVYETIGERRQDTTSPESSAKEPVGSTRTGDVPKTTSPLKMGGISSEKRTPKVHPSQPANSSFSIGRNPASGRVTHSAKMPSNNNARSSSDPRERCESSSKLPDGSRSERVAQSAINRYSTESGAVYSMVDTKTGKKAGGDHGEVRGQGKDVESDVDLPKRIQPQTKPMPHRALSSSLSDTSSDSWQPKTQDFSTSESDMERRSSSAHGPEAFSDDGGGMETRLKNGSGGEREEEDILDPEKRRAMLELNWSHQSLDKNMREVATSTVAALGTLMEVLTTPAQDSLDKKFQFDIEDSVDGADSTERKWYQNSDDDEEQGTESSSATFSPCHISSATSPTDMTTPLQLAPPGSHRKSSDEGNRFFQASHRTNGDEISDSLKPHTQPITRTTSAKLPISVRGDSQVDGNMFSRSPSDGRVKKAGQKPPVPPKKRSRSKSAGSGLHSSTGNTRAGSTRQVVSSAVTVDWRNGKDSTSTIRTSLESSPTSRTNLTSQGSKSSSHEYAILEPPLDHDYAILDPEYHEEFYGYCFNCTEPVIGMKNGCAALGRVYHNKCFNCWKCGTSLSNQSFYTHQGHLLCERDHMVIFERCHGCKKKIDDRVLKALGHSYHPSCFRCVVCSQCLDGIHYTSDVKGRIYCIHDYHKIYGPKCDVCQKSITPRNGQKRSLRVIAMDKNYHIHCYKCEDCGKQLANRTGGGVKCYPLDGHLLCRSCHAQRVHAEDDAHVPAESHAHHKMHNSNITHSDNHTHHRVRKDDMSHSDNHTHYRVRKDDMSHSDTHPKHNNITSSTELSYLVST